MNDLTETIAQLPHHSGVYLFSDISGEVLYVGKAKDLKKRVSSYFRKSASLSISKKIMVKKIDHIKTILTHSEVEALLLETNLIKKHRPQYNVLMKDDKSHQYIKIDRSDDYPKIITVRKITDPESRYFGPFTNGYAIKKTLAVLRSVFPYRDCGLKITHESVQKRKHRACLKYHIKTCAAPCIGKISHEDYQRLIERSILFLQGKNKEIAKELELEMKDLASEKKFEKAALARDNINALKVLEQRQTITHSRNAHEDYLSVYTDKKHGHIVSLIIIRDGKVVGQENFHIEAPIDTSRSDILTSFIVDYYQTSHAFPHTIYTQNTVDISNDAFRQLLKSRNVPEAVYSKIRIETPQKGKKKKIIEMGILNAQNFLHNHASRTHNKRLGMSELKDALILDRLPYRIECFDISQVQGTNAVASMSVYIDGEPAPQEYRRFKIKTVSGQDDFAMMHEVLTRRLKKTYVLNEWDAPHLIVIDGGKGQLSSAMKSLSAFFPDAQNIHMISLAKREELVFLPHKKYGLRLRENSAGLKLLQGIRDEAHRFAVTYHRKLRSKASTRSSLDSIPGVGPKTRNLLLKKFKSIDAIKNASVRELSQHVSPARARLIYDTFHTE